MSSPSRVWNATPTTKPGRCGWFYVTTIVFWQQIQTCFVVKCKRTRYALTDQLGDVLADDGRPEDDAVQDVADGAVGGAPHLLEPELLHAGLFFCKRREMERCILMQMWMKCDDGQSVCLNKNAGECISEKATCFIRSCWFGCAKQLRSGNFGPFCPNRPE